MEKVRFLTEPWCPPKRFKWSYTERKDRGNARQKYLGPLHFTGKFDVFSYSLSKGGIYCHPCAILAPDEVRGVKLGRIVKTPLQKHTHLTAKNGHLTEHLSKQFYKDCLSRSNAFVALVKAMQETLSSKRTSEPQSNARKTEWLWKVLFFPSSFPGDWAFLCADTVIPELCLCLHRDRRTLSTICREIFEQCCNSWQRGTTKLFTRTSAMLEEIPPISRQEFEIISWMPWVRV